MPSCSIVLDQSRILDSESHSTHLGGGVTTFTSNKPGFLALRSGLLRLESCDLPPLLLLPGLSLLLARATTDTARTLEDVFLALLLGLHAGTYGAKGLTVPQDREQDCICEGGGGSEQLWSWLWTTLWM